MVPSSIRDLGFEIHYTYVLFFSNTSTCCDTPLSCLQASVLLQIQMKHVWKEMCFKCTAWLPDLYYSYYHNKNWSTRRTESRLWMPNTDDFACPLFYRKCSDNFEPIVVEVLNAYIVQWFIFLYPNIVCHVATLYQTSSRFNFDI